jgi:predicted RND superfamily exporter protein
LVPRDGNVFTAGALSAIVKMTHEAWRIPHAARVFSLANFNHSYANGDEIIIEPLYGAETTLDSAKIAQIRKIVLNEPELLHRLVSPDGGVTGIDVLLIKNERDDGATAEIAAHARKLKARWQKAYPGIQIRLSGSIIGDDTYREAAQRDMRILIPLTAILIFSLIAIGLASVAVTVATTLVMTGGAVAALGFAGWAGMTLNVSTAVSPLAVMVLTIASCVHIIWNWLQARAAGSSSFDGLRTSLTLNIPPITVTNLTTAIGFLCMNFADAPPLRDMGNFVAFGIVVGWLLSLTALPCMLSFLPTKRRIRLRILPVLMERLSDFTIGRRRALFLVFIAGLGVAGFGINQIVLDDDYIRYFDHSFEFRRDTEVMEQRLTGLHGLQYSFDSKSDGGVFDPSFLEKLERFTGWLEKQDHVVYVSALTKLLKRLNKSMNGDDPAAYALPETRQHNAQYILFYELSVPVGHDLNSLIDITRSKTLVTIIVRDTASKDLRALSARAEAWLRENTPDIAARTTGLSVLFAYLSERNIKSMIWGTSLALILISAIMFFTLKSVRFGLISLMPNLYPAFLAFGIWGMTVSTVNLASSVVTAMTLGIVVDDTIHILMKYTYMRRKEGLLPEDALRRTMSSVGPALVITSVAIIVGLLVMGLSGFQINQHIGLLTALVVGVALLADLLLLPPLLLFVDRRQN